MPQRLFSEPRAWIIALLLAALAVVQSMDYEALFAATPKARNEVSAVTPASVDEMVSQALQTYDIETYRNVVDDNLFAVNAVKAEPVAVVKPEPKPEPPPPPPPKPKPPVFTANLEVTGIAITPERKLVMVWDKSRKQTHVLTERETIHRWRVVSIDKQRVVLRHPLGGRYEFVVNEETLTNFNN